MIEFFPKSRQVLAGTCWSILDGLVYMVTTLYFWKVDNDWSKYFYFVFGANIISLVGTFFLPESPRMLHELGREDEANQVLDQISRCNKNVPHDFDENGSSLNEPLLHS